MFSFLRGFLWLCIRSLAWLLRHAPFLPGWHRGPQVHSKLIWQSMLRLLFCLQQRTAAKEKLCVGNLFLQLVFSNYGIQFFIYLPTYFWETNYQTAIFRQLFFSFFPFKSIFCSNWIFTIAIAEIICVVTALWSVQCFEEALEDFCPINHRKILLQQKVGHFTFIHIAENLSKTTFSESFLKWSKVKLSCCSTL